MKERFKRVVNFYGEDGFEKIRNARVLIAGLGGVGSHCASALARSGVGSLVLVDFDNITESSLNRNAIVGEQWIDQSKAEALSRTLTSLCPDTECIPVKLFITKDTLEAPDFMRDSHMVVDAVDSVNPKTQLLQYCAENGITVFSSMGAAGKRDPSKIETGDISDTNGCPLARMVRKYLKRRGVITGISCVWSTEQGIKPLPPDNSEPILDSRGRTRNALPSLITMPGIFGYILAQMVLDNTAGES
ncbi:MAG: tRNA threonylcarbamoyladenosine dehydratase [Candidatus Sabulitectum sp.]|nr:tRNA threonylcarbamoyladenosine dehydratase [Candidatus Sabulitectum sp.]